MREPPGQPSAVPIRYRHDQSCQETEAASFTLVVCPGSAVRLVTNPEKPKGKGKPSPDPALQGHSAPKLPSSVAPLPLRLLSRPAGCMNKVVGGACIRRVATRITSWGVHKVIVTVSRLGSRQTARWESSRIIGVAHVTWILRCVNRVISAARRCSLNAAET